MTPYSMLSKEKFAAQVIDLVRSHSTSADALIDEGTSVSALGVDSIDLMEIVFRLEELHGVEISPEGMSERETVGQVIDYAYKTIISSR